MIHRPFEPDHQKVRGTHLAFLCPLLFAFGCDSTEPSCKETAQVYELAQANATGVTGNAFANHAIGVHPVRISLARAPGQPSPVTPVFPDQSTGTLTISLAPGARWSHVISELVPCPSGTQCTDIAVQCIDYYSVPVKARLTAFNGTIDEVWQGELRGLDANDPETPTDSTGQSEAASLALRRDASTFLGNFKVASPQLRPSETLISHEIVISAKFKDGALLKAEIMEHSERKEAGGKHAATNGSFGRLIEINPAPKAE